MPSDRLTGFSSAFDELLERNRRELDALSGGSGGRAFSPTSRTFTSSSTSSATVATRDVAQGVSTRATTSPPVARSPAERVLDEKLGADWRYEVLDRTREGGEMIVRCRVTAPARGVSRTWHGSAPLSGARRRSRIGDDRHGRKRAFQPWRECRCPDGRPDPGRTGGRTPSD